MLNEGVPIARSKSKVHGTKSSNEEYDKAMLARKACRQVKSPEHWSKDSPYEKYQNKHSPNHRGNKPHENSAHDFLTVLGQETPSNKTMNSA